MAEGKFQKQALRYLLENKDEAGSKYFDHVDLLKEMSAGDARYFIEKTTVLMPDFLYFLEKDAPIELYDILLNEKAMPPVIGKRKYIVTNGQSADFISGEPFGLI